MQFIVEKPTPIFSKPSAFQEIALGKIQLDEQKLYRPLEWIALPGTYFTFIAEESGVFEVSSPSYSSSSSLFIDLRSSLIRFTDQEEKIVPNKTKEEIVQDLLGTLGAPYLWGGNFCEGISYSWFPKMELVAEKENVRRFYGVDCSGLFYQVMEGRVPRNCTELAKAGQTVIPNTLSVEGVIAALKPLDVLIFPSDPWHMAIVIDPETTIESRLARGGVHLRNLNERIEELFDQGLEWDNELTTSSFIIRRFPETLFK